MTTATPSSGGRRTQSQSTSRSKTQAAKSQAQRNQPAQKSQAGQKSQAAEKSQTATTAKAQSSSSQSSSSRSGSGQQSSGSTWHLPFVTAQFHAPEMHVPGKEQITSAANTAVEQASSAVSTVREQMPSREHAIFYGALGGAAVLSVIEWPVALAIGVGTALVNRGKSDKTPSSAR